MSRPFRRERFFSDMQSAFGFKKHKRQLKPDAVPSVFIFTKKRKFHSVINIDVCTAVTSLLNGFALGNQ